MIPSFVARCGRKVTFEQAKGLTRKKEREKERTKIFY